MGRIIEGGARYWYRNYTTEGKISSLPRKVEATEAILNLKRHLEDAGIDTSQMDVNIQNAGVALSQDLSILLGGEPQIVINATEVIGVSLSSKGLLSGAHDLLQDIDPQ